MCGIVVALAFGKLNKKEEAIRQQIMRFMTTEMLVLTEPRGKDATGAAILFTDGNYFGIKRGEEVTSFLAKTSHDKDNYGSLSKLWMEYEQPVKVYLGHCRKGTKGDKEDNANNHPIKIGNIVGIHNGGIENADEIFKRLGCKRDGEVDSEAIFRLFDYFTDNGKEPFSMDMVEELIKRLSGPFAVTCFNADNPFQIPMFRDGRPIELIFLKEYGILFAVSDIQFWTIAQFRYERLVSYTGVGLPSILGMTIEKEMMTDDSAYLFDLTIKCNKETKLKDLGQWRKIGRTKVWDVIPTKTNNTYNWQNNNSYNKKADENKTLTSSKTVQSKTTDKKDEKPGDGEELRRVFNHMTKRYETKAIGQKTVKDNESVVIPLTKDSTTKSTAEVQTGNKPTETEAVASEAIKDKGLDTDEITPGSSKAVAIEDKTDYSSPTAVKQTTVENKTENDELVVVDMTPEPPEFVAAANEEYNRLPMEKRGYGDLDTLLHDLDIAKPALASLGSQYVANRVAKLKWVQGFIAGCKWFTKNKKSDEDSTEKNEKTKKQEKHIANLKTLVAILAGYFSRTYLKFQNAVVKDMADEVKFILDTTTLDVDETEKLFNEYQKVHIKDAVEAVKVVQKSMEKAKALTNSANAAGGTGKDESQNNSGAV